MVTAVVLLIGIVVGTDKEVVIDRFDSVADCHAAIMQEKLPSLTDLKCVWFHRGEITAPEKGPFGGGPS